MKSTEVKVGMRVIVTLPGHYQHGRTGTVISVADLGILIVEVNLDDPKIVPDRPYLCSNPFPISIGSISEYSE